MALKPWYNVTPPRDDLKEGRPLDAAEFAVHLDQIRDERAPAVYQEPVQFFQRTHLTRNLLDLGSQVVRRLSGETTETSAVFNMTTQFGGGKTHALTLLYHLARHGPEANRWHGVSKVLSQAGVPSAPRAGVAVFVGTEFDSISGRGGDDGSPLRRTPWGEIAFQLGGAAALQVLAEHEQQMQAPGGDVIRRFLPKDRPALILLDELMNYVSRSRKSGMGTQFYNFLQNLSEEARGRKNLVVAVSIPASEMEMNAEDQADYDRFKKMLDRLGKAMVMSAEGETSEIIRRRLFEWDPAAESRSGKVLLPKDAIETCRQYANWLLDHRQQLPTWFPVDNAVEEFESAYPLHPAVLSVFQRKWQALPRFQQTRGVLRLLALWVSRAYVDGYKGAHKDPLISLGTATLEDPLFRAALFEQLGEGKLEAAVTTDIIGKSGAHAERMDKEAVDTLKKARLHRKVATSIFFESNGGTTRNEATVPEIRLAVAEPDLDFGNIETVQEALESHCYYLYHEKNRYRFGVKPNLNSVLADRRASIQPPAVEDKVRQEIQKAFPAQKGIERVFFPERSSQVLDRPALTFVVLPPEQAMEDQPKTLRFVEGLLREAGSSGRTFKSALLFCVADSPIALREEARKALAWEAIQDEGDSLGLDDTQKRQAGENLKRAQRDLREAAWRSYKHLLLLGKDNAIRTVDLGLVHSSAANSLVDLILNRLKQDGDVESSISPNFLVRNWPAFPEWSTKAVRDAFFASPKFPRLLNAEAVKDTIARGVTGGMLAYVGKSGSGRYEPFYFETHLDQTEVEVSEDMFILKDKDARKHVEPPKMTTLSLSPAQAALTPGKRQAFVAKGLDQHGQEIAVSGVFWTATGGTIQPDGVFLAGTDEGNFAVTVAADGVSAIASVTIQKAEPPVIIERPRDGKKRISWSGEIPPQKWTNFYMKVLSKFAGDTGLKLTVSVEATAEGAEAGHRVQEMKTALRELGLEDVVKTE